MKKEKSTYQKIIDGEIEPRGEQKGWRNLEAGRVSFNQMTPERAHEIRSMGGKAVQELHGKRKSARESLEDILTLKITPEIMAGADIPQELAERLKRDNPNATLYDLISMVAVGRAMSGSVPAMQYVRDTHGDKPIDKIEVTDNVTTEQDREMMRKIAERLETGEITVVRDISGEDK